MTGKYPTTFYRVSLKALISNDKGEVLVVKENDSQWPVRDGGSDHEETIHDALRREVYEEALIKAELIETLLDMASLYLELKEVWLLWLVYKIEMNLFTYGAREDANEVVFMNPDVFKDSIYQSGQLV